MSYRIFERKLCYRGVSYQLYWSLQYNKCLIFEINIIFSISFPFHIASPELLEGNFICSKYLDTYFLNNCFA